MILFLKVFLHLTLLGFLKLFQLKMILNFVLLLAIQRLMIGLSVCKMNSIPCKVVPFYLTRMILAPWALGRLESQARGPVLALLCNVPFEQMDLVYEMELGSAHH